VLDERAPGIRSLGGAARWWLAQSLRTLQEALRERGAPLLLRRGSAPGVIAGLAREIDAGAVYWNEIAQAPHQRVADQLAAALGEIDVTTHRFPGDLLVAPNQIRNKENRGLRVFTPFWRRVQALGDPPKPLPAPKRLSGLPNLASDGLEDWKLEPTRPDWAGGLRDNWQPGEMAAQARLKAFLEGSITCYSGDRDRPDRDGTSRLSPHLRFGEISPRQVEKWPHDFRFRIEACQTARPGLAKNSHEHSLDLVIACVRRENRRAKTDSR